MTFFDKCVIAGVAAGLAFMLMAIYDTQFKKEYEPEEDLFL